MPTQNVIDTPHAGEIGRVAKAILAWYDTSRRDLPWRGDPGQAVDPYAVWLSEIMLQQTTVKAVRPYFEKFLHIWPQVHDLAAAELNDVLKAWSGLGYYSRARNLHACAQKIVDEYSGRFPETEAELLKLPGIGPYTAAAIASIAFGEAATVVDGNVERVVSRLFAVTTPLPDAKPELKALAAQLTPTQRAGDYAQGMMDLGATICSPKKPSCMICPVQSLCDGHRKGIAAELPKKRPKPERPVRKGIAFLALREDGKILLRERPKRGLLGGMTEVPSTDWTEEGPVAEEADTISSPTLNTLAPVRADWAIVPGFVTHTFTHFKLELIVYRSVVSPQVPLNLWAKPESCRWVDRADVHDEALPSVMRKVIAHGLDI